MTINLFPICNIGNEHRFDYTELVISTLEVKDDLFVIHLEKVLSYDRMK